MAHVGLLMHPLYQFVHDFTHSFQKGLTGQYIPDHEMTEKVLDFQRTDVFGAEYCTVSLTFLFIKFIQANLIYFTQIFVSPAVEVFFKIINR
ncbi:MAG TPA: hypothetical protein PLC35_02125, partial [Methanosarcina vacuolata]|nr:hypothetical protein [Methanosarcina vacuolata]